MLTSWRTRRPVHPTDSHVDTSRLIAASLCLTSFCLGLIYFVAIWMQRGGFAEQISFQFWDPPYLPRADSYPPYPPGMNGVHYAGDFFEAIWQSRQKPSPYLGATSSYPPFANMVLWPLAPIPYWRAYLLFFTTCFAVMITVTFRMFKEAPTSLRISAIMTTLVFTQGTFSALDRGNTQVLAVALSLLSIYVVFSKTRLSALQVDLLAGSLLGLATGLRLYPILFALVFVYLRRIWAIVSTGATFIICTGLSLAVMGGTTSENLRAFRFHLSTVRGPVVDTFVAYNNSLRGLSLSLRQWRWDFLEPIASLLESQSRAVLAVLAILTFVVVARSGVTTLFETALLCSSLMVLGVDYAPPYTLLVFIVPTAIAFRFGTGTNSYLRYVYVVGLAILFAPKGVALRFWTPEVGAAMATWNSFLNPGILLLFLLIIIVKEITSWACDLVQKHST